MRTRNRPGFGMFQLLVVLAVLLILLGLLFPAVQKVREAAGRMKSMNNMKGIGIALHTYESIFNKLPAGSTAGKLSVFAYLLPYVDQDPLFKSLDRTKGPDDKANAAARETRIAIYLHDRDLVENETTKAAPTSYHLIAGSKPELAGNDGVFAAGVQSTLVGITDGTSNTIWTTEILRGNGSTKAVTVRRQHVRLKKADLKGITSDAGDKDFKAGTNVVGNRGSAWIDGAFLQSVTTVTMKFDAESPDADCEGVGGVAAVRSLGAGVNVGMADGSVRFLSAATDFTTLQAVATKAGGEVVNLP